MEEEQSGSARAGYGKQVLEQVSRRLTKEFGRGFSLTNVEQMRKFYRVYSQDEIPQKVSEELGANPSGALSNALSGALTSAATGSTSAPTAGNDPSVRNNPPAGNKLLAGSNSQAENNPPVAAARKFFLSWSHYLKLMRIEDIGKRHFYEIESYRNNWSLSEMQRQLDSGLYERLALSCKSAAKKDSKNAPKKASEDTGKDATNNVCNDAVGVGAKDVYKEAEKNTSLQKLQNEGQAISSPADAIKDPYVLEFLGLKEETQYSETELESRIIDHLQEFLLELGRGFAFVGRQQRFTYEEDHFKVDLVFYNRLLRCFVLFDLKLDKLTHQDIGQMQMYVNYYDRKVKLDDENPTIGVLLCQDKNDAVVEMTLPEDNEQIFASKYKTVLPSKEELKVLLDQAYAPSLS